MFAAASQGALGLGTCAFAGAVFDASGAVLAVFGASALAYEVLPTGFVGAPADDCAFDEVVVQMEEGNGVQGGMAVGKIADADTERAQRIVQHVLQRADAAVDEQGLQVFKGGWPGRLMALVLRLDAGQVLLGDLRHDELLESAFLLAGEPGGDRFLGGLQIDPDQVAVHAERVGLFVTAGFGAVRRLLPTVCRLIQRAGRCSGSSPVSRPADAESVLITRDCVRSTALAASESSPLSPGLSLAGKSSEQSE